MRILYVHNYHGDGIIGGEEVLLRQQTEVMQAHGHEVYEHFRRNSEYIEKPAWRKVVEFKNLIWSDESYREIQEQIHLFRPDIMHVHNFWMVLSPSIFRAAHNMGVATVMNLNDYRLTCANALLLRNGKPCELCVGRNPWRAMYYRCYGNHLTASIAVSLMLWNSFRKGIWRNDVDAFVSLTEFGRRKMSAHGLPVGKIHVLSDFRLDPLLGKEPCPPGHGAIVVGRLSAEKGLHTLMKAWRNIDYPLTVVGDGPLRRELESVAPCSVRFTGFVSDEELCRLRKQNAFAVFPSECYEGFGAAMIESMAFGRAVIACDLGGRSDVVEHGKNGFLYQASNHEDLREKILIMTPNRTRIVEMGRNARETYLNGYTGEHGYQGLKAIYKEVLSEKRRPRSV